VSAMWWKVKPPIIDSEFLVLVIEGRVVTSTRRQWFFAVGDKWDSVRQMLEKAGFTCVMVPS